MPRCGSQFYTLFTELSASLHEPKLAMTLASCYALSDVIWFLFRILHGRLMRTVPLCYGPPQLHLGGTRPDGRWDLSSGRCKQGHVLPKRDYSQLPFVLLIIFQQGRMQIFQFHLWR